MPEYRGDDTGERVVVSTKEIAEGRTGSIDEFGNRHYTRVWNVLVNNINAEALEVTATGSLPARFSYYGHPGWPNLNGAVDLGATLRRYECEQLPELVQWRVTAHYDSTPTQTKFDYNPNDYGGTGGFNTGDPIEQTPIGRASQVQWGTLRYQHAIVRDLDGKPTVASNGQRYDPPVTVDRAYLVLNITRNEADYVPSTAINYIDRINSTAWNLGGAINYTVGAGLAKCESITAQSMVEQGIFFWRVSYTFHINPNLKDDGSSEGWQPELLDVGTYYYKQISGPKLVKQPIVDPLSGIPITSPVPLDGQGRELQPTSTGFPVVYNYANSYRTFRVYGSANFNTLGLP